MTNLLDFSRNVFNGVFINFNGQKSITKPRLINKVQIFLFEIRKFMTKDKINNIRMEKKLISLDLIRRCLKSSQSQKENLVNKACTGCF